MSISGGFIFDPRSFWGDFDVLMMTPEQVGIYVRLLSMQWENSYIPEDVETIAVLASTGRFQLSNDSLNESLERVVNMVFPVVETGRRQNPRLAAERAEWKTKHGKRSAAGKKAGKVSAAKRRESARERPKGTSRNVPETSNDSLDESLTNRSLSYPIPSDPVPSDPSPPAKAPRGGRLTIPEKLRAIGIDEEAVKRRKASAKTKKVTAWQSELNGLAEMIDEVGGEFVKEVFEAAITGGWAGCSKLIIREQFQRRKPKGSRRDDEQRRRMAAGASRQTAAEIEAAAARSDKATRDELAVIVAELPAKFPRHAQALAECKRLLSLTRDGRLADCDRFFRQLAGDFLPWAESAGFHGDRVLAVLERYPEIDF